MHALLVATVEIALGDSSGPEISLDFASAAEAADYLRDRILAGTFGAFNTENGFELGDIKVNILIALL